MVRLQSWRPSWGQTPTHIVYICTLYESNEIFLSWILASRAGSVSDRSSLRLQRLLRSLTLPAHPITIESTATLKTSRGPHETQMPMRLHITRGHRNLAECDILRN